MMKTKQPNRLAVLLKDFFENHLSKIRGMSPHTIHSYRDSMVLYLRFIAFSKNGSVSSLNLKDLSPQEVHSFLNHLEQERNNSISTRNNRLSAIHSFFRFVAAQHPDRLEHAQQILGIPFKKTHSRMIDYLEYDEIQKILSVIDRTKPKGRRDYALIATMFNTGARVQEILDLKGCDLQLTKPFHVKLMGKGRKQRCCPIWSPTTKLLRQLCLLKSGVDLSTISQWLGHSNLNTTNLYATIDLTMKRKAIEKIRPIQDQQICLAPWQDKTILEWLESL